METIHKKFIKPFWSGTITCKITHIFGIMFAIGKETADKKKRIDVKCKNKISNR